MNEIINNIVNAGGGLYLILIIGYLGGLTSAIL